MASKVYFHLASNNEIYIDETNYEYTDKYKHKNENMNMFCPLLMIVDVDLKSKLVSEICYQS